MDLSGKTIGGCTIKKKIGEGGGGMVLLGSHPDFGQEVVLKVLPKSNLTDEQTRLRFEREISMHIELTHENIVQVFQANADDEYYYLLMEYVDGPDVDQAMERKGKFPYEEATGVILQIANALAFAHGRQIIHRDIKPSNILINKSGKAKLCDFGLAKDLRINSNLTSAGMVFGTPNFMSPEQWFGAKDLTAQSDIFSLGATFYYMITARKPFEGESATAIMSNSLFGVFVSPKEYAEGIPDPLCGMIEKMLARELKDRYKTAGDVARDLTHFSKGGKKGFFGKLFGT
ncbi:MAG: serine/threonine protein kinase [Candidatus Aureabacteria bacterium]|nr:serine/threonine protein kinase [Candidatus Auribacterota bacterium]